jgi:type I restriction enzyme S subunit
MIMATLTVEKPELGIKVPEVSVKSFWLSLGEMRLDASFYTQEVSKATRLLEESGYGLTDIGQLSKDVFTLARIKRFYGDSNATPYLMPSELFDFPLSPTKYVYAGKIKNVERWFLKEGWLLITCSGKVGMPLIATKLYESFIVSHDVARVIPKTDTQTGFLYAYLLSWIGKALLTKDQYGVAVDHIEPHHVKSVKVPLLPQEIQKIVQGNIVKVFNLRDKARNLLTKAQNDLLTELDVPNPNRTTRARSFFVKSTDLKLRFDASYHIPFVKDVREKLKHCKYKTENLGKHVQEPFIPNRFKRIYVEGEYGVPFFSGSNIVQIKPYDVKYLSKRATAKLETCLVHKGWVLLTRSGTVGRVALVPSNWDGCAVTEDVIRVIPKFQEIHSGFLTAFLQSDYGTAQVISKIYDGVVDHLAEEDVKDIEIPIPPFEVQERIGKLVVEAYEWKELANKIEEETVRTLENMLEEHKKIEINEEYLKEINAYADSFELIGNEEFQESLEELESGEFLSFDEFKKEHGF